MPKPIDKPLAKTGKAAFEHVKDGASVVIGNRTDKDGAFQHAIHASKWDGEAWLSVSAADVETDGKDVKFVKHGGKDAVEAVAKRGKGQTQRTETHRFREGSTEWEIEWASLADVPAGEYVAFALDFPAGLEFFYQPALTPEEIAEGCERPDDVVGSYAVYWAKAGRILRADGTERINYETGKFAHIYRPEWIAANGERRWGEQEIVAGELRIAIPLAWIQSLGSAAWPLTLDPTFGYDTQGGTASQLASGYLWGAGVYSVAVAGTLDSVSCYTLGAYGLTLGVYADSSGYPGALVGDSDGGTSSNGGWTTQAVSGNLTAGSYWLAANEDGGIFLYYDSVAGYSLKYKGGQTYSAGTLNATFPDGATNWADVRFSIYATYTEAEAAGPPTGGTWTIDFGSEITDPLNWNATAAEVQTALRALPSLTPDKVAVSGDQWPVNGGAFVLTFADLGSDPPEVTINSYLTGGDPTITPATTQGWVADGQPMRLTFSGGGATSGTFDTWPYGDWPGDPPYATIAWNAIAAEIAAAIEAIDFLSAFSVISGTSLDAGDVVIEAVVNFNLSVFVIKADNTAGGTGVGVVVNQAGIANTPEIQTITLGYTEAGAGRVMFGSPLIHRGQSRRSLIRCGA